MATKKNIVNINLCLLWSKQVDLLMNNNNQMCVFSVVNIYFMPLNLILHYL